LQPPSLPPCSFDMRAVVTQSASSPTGVSACHFGLIVKEDATVASHDHGSAVAVGGILTDGTPTESSVISGASWVNTLGGPSNGFIFAGGVTLGQGLPLDFAHFEYLAGVIQPSSVGGGTIASEISDVHVHCSGGTFDFDDFCSDCSSSRDSPGGRNVLVFFNTPHTVRITGTRSGHKWWGSILAPFAELVVDGSTGFVDGQIIARSYREEGAPGQLQLHGHCFSGQHDWGLGSGAQNSFRCGRSSCGSASGATATRTPSLLNSISTSSSSGAASSICFDRKPAKKCARKVKKNKCHRRGARKKCAHSCGACTSG
jgi:hypothetical protein